MAQLFFASIQIRRWQADLPRDLELTGVIEGVDILAPAVGNMHGMLQAMVQGSTRKRLDLTRNREIKSASGSWLTLHGGSGTDDEDLQKAIAAEINIIHINTELRVPWRRGLENAFASKPNEIVPYKLLPLSGGVGQAGRLSAAAIIQSAAECHKNVLNSMTSPS